MSKSKQYAVGEIVWAKISGYPWWPAKVHQCLGGEGESRMYQVFFYADTT